MRFISLILLVTIGVIRAECTADLANVASMTRPPLQEIRYATTYNFTGERL